MGGIASIVGTVGGGLLGGGFGAALGGSVGGAIDSASAANDAEKANRRATDAQLQGIRESNQLQRDMFNAQVGLQSYQRGIGNQALAQLGGLYGLQGGYDPAGSTTFDASGHVVNTPAGAAPNGGGAGGTGSPDFSAFMNSPDYLFAQQEGQRGLDATAAAGGNLFGGGRAVAASRFNQGLASQQFGNYANRLASLAGIGQASTNQLGQSLQNTGNNISQGLTSAGDVRASGYNTGSNIRSNQLNNLFGLVQGGLSAYGGNSFGGGGGTGAPAWNYNLG